RPALADRVDPALVGDQLLPRGLHRSDQGRDAEQQPAEEQGDRPEPDHVQVVAQEVGHRRRRYYSSSCAPQLLTCSPGAHMSPHWSRPHGRRRVRWARRRGGLPRQNAVSRRPGAMHGAMRTAIEAIVARVPAWAGRSPVVRTLPGHAREQVFAVAVDGHEYVVRRSSDTELLGLSPANTVEATSRAADLGVGPPLAAVVDRHTLITEMVAGSVLVTEAVADRLEPVVRALRRLHRSAPLQASFPVHRVVEWHARDAGANEAVVPTSYERLHQLSRRIESTFARSPMNPVPCHNNLVPAN